MNRALYRVAVMLGLLTLSTISVADPPGRVARLAEYAGDVRVASSHESWQPVYRNHVVTAGDNLWVSDGGRAELDVGPLQVWLAGGSNVYFERFDDQNLVARLASGALAVRIRQWEPKDAMRVATEHGEISFVQPGLYIVSAGSAHYPSVATTRFGQAELNSFGRVQWVNRGDTLAFDQNGARIDRYAYSGAATGGFESWVSARDRRIDRWEARNRGEFDPWMIGVRDLDDHGYWQTSYEYGRVWYPQTVSSGWAPYRYGRWTWVQPWGWTWVDDAPWGFAPFHYGRWVRIGGRWAWCPGSYVGRAVYAPALVAFYGGSNWSVSVTSGPAYSWVPLGWNEPYAPWYNYSRNYWRHVNRPYVRNTAEDPWRPPAYIHATAPGAVTTVAAAAFVAGRHVSQHYVRNTAEIDLRSAPPARMGEVIPQFRASRPAASVGTDPNPIVNVQPPGRGGAVVNDPVTSRTTAPAIVRAPMATTIQPNRDVPEVRVWQEPNPVAPRAQIRESAPTVVRESSPGLPNRGIPERQYRRIEPVPEIRTNPGNGVVPQDRVAPPALRERKPAPAQEFRSENFAPPGKVVAESRGNKLHIEKPNRREALAPVAEISPQRAVQADAQGRREAARTQAREAKTERREAVAERARDQSERGNKIKEKVREQ
jgi:hypothetical protein